MHWIIYSVPHILYCATIAFHANLYDAPLLCAFLGSATPSTFSSACKVDSKLEIKRRPVAVSPQNSNVPAKALALFQSGAGGNWKLRKLTTTSPPAILLHHQRVDILKSLCIACLEDRDAQLNTSQPLCHGRCKKRAVSTRPEHKPETLSWKP